MTIQKSYTKDKNNIKIGNIIKKHRKHKMFEDNLSNRSRENFIDSVTWLPPDWISVKALMNIELGKNLPSLKVLIKLAIAFEMEPNSLIKEIEPYIYITD